MGNEKVLTNQEKWDLVKKLLVEGKTFREIEKIAHVSPNFITKVKIVEFGQDSVYAENENIKKNKKLSKRTQAINLFYQGKTPKKVLLELDIDVNEVKRAQSDYLQLSDLDHLSEIFQNNSSNLIKEFYSLFRIFKELGLDTIEKVKEIKELVEVYPHLQHEISQLNKETHILKKKKQFDEKVLNDIEYKISLANTSLQMLENQISSKKIMLENLEILEKKKNTSVFNDEIKKIIELTVKEESWYKTTVLPLMIISVIQVIRNDPIGKTMLLDFYAVLRNSLFLTHLANLF